MIAHIHTYLYISINTIHKCLQNVLFIIFGAIVHEIMIQANQMARKWNNQFNLHIHTLFRFIKIAFKFQSQATRLNVAYRAAVLAV